MLLDRTFWKVPMFRYGMQMLQHPYMTRRMWIRRIMWGALAKSDS